MCLFTNLISVLLTPTSSESLHIIVYTLSCNVMYPSSTVHTADYTWQFNYILPRALGTKKYSRAATLPDARFALCQLVGGNLIKLKFI